jgi:hypothetical protein
MKHTETEPPLGRSVRRSLTMVVSESQLRKQTMNMPNNEQEAWAEILKARDAVAVAKTENEIALSQLNLARAELDYEIIETLRQLHSLETETSKNL